MARKIKEGDFYMDCSYHPCLCTEVDGDDIFGISLVDGSFPRSCSVKHCAPRKLSFNQARVLRLLGPVGKQFAHERDHGESAAVIKACGLPWWKKTRGKG
jgi:hypothetical protein